MIMNRVLPGLFGGVLRLAVLVAAVLMVFPVGYADAAGITIDDFSDLQTVTVATITTTTNCAAAPAALGNNRCFIDQKTTGTDGLEVTLKTTVADNLSWSIESTAAGRGAIVYSGTNSTGGLALGQNFITGANAASRFAFSVIQLDEPIDLLFEVTNTAGTTTLSATMTIDNTGNFYVDFADFGTPAQVNAVFSSIGRIKVSWEYLTPALAFDMTLDDLRTECVIETPVINSFSAVTPVAFGATSTTLSWNITPGASNPESARITSSCSSSTPYAISGSDVYSGSDTFNITSFACTFTLKAIGYCENATSQVIVTQAPPPGRVPSLNEWGMIILSLFLAGSAIWMLRRKRTGK